MHNALMHVTALSRARAISFSGFLFSRGVATIARPKWTDGIEMNFSLNKIAHPIGTMCCSMPVYWKWFWRVYETGEHLIDTKTLTKARWTERRRRGETNRTAREKRNITHQIFWQLLSLWKTYISFWLNCSFSSVLLSVSLSLSLPSRLLSPRSPFAVVARVAPTSCEHYS